MIRASPRTTEATEEGINSETNIPGNTKLKSITKEPVFYRANSITESTHQQGNTTQNYSVGEMIWTARKRVILSQKQHKSSTTVQSHKLLSCAPRSDTSVYHKLSIPDIEW